MKVSCSPVDTHLLMCLIAMAEKGKHPPADPGAYGASIGTLTYEHCAGHTGYGLRPHRGRHLPDHFWSTGYLF